MANAILALRKDIKFNEDLPGRYKCILCKKLLIITHQTPCGCRVCKVCGEEYFYIVKPCPSKETDCDLQVQKTDLTVDRAADREILKLLAQCIFKPCESRYSIQEMEDHLISCEYRTIKCPQCNEPVSMKNLTEHQTNECNGRLIKCQYCTEEKTAKEMQFKHHNVESEQLCEQFREMCPNNCNQQEKLLLKRHMQECPLRKITCPYPECQQNPMNMENLLKHFREKEKEHVEIQIKKNQELAAQIIELQDQIKVVKEIFQDMRTILEATSKSYIMLEQKYKEMTAKAPVNIINTNIQPLLPINGNPYIWKITDYEEKYAAAISNGESVIQSEPFYTRPYGYKLCMKLYPNGDNTGRDTHMSIFFAIMKTEHDLVLKWPFNRQVTFTMLHPGGEPGHQQIFKTGEGTGYDRPTEECNPGQGAPRFITQVNLRNIYLRENCIFVRISVND